MNLLNLRMLLKTSAAVSLLAMSQMAAADGTDAGITISNSATASFEVGGVAQTDVSSAPADFVVDRIVTFTLEEIDGANTTPVAPGEQNAVTLFRLTNTSNSVLDFTLGAVNNASGTDTNGATDDDDMGATFEFLVANGDGAAGVPEAGDLAFVDALAENASVVIAVLADAELDMADGAVAGITLTATAADSGVNAAVTGVGSAGAVLVAATADDVAAVDTVFNDAGNDGLETAVDGYVIAAATLSINKTATVVDDPVNTAAPFFAIPGATIEYAIEITNAGTSTASNVVISDQLTGELLFGLTNLPSGTGNVSITIGANPADYCVAEEDTDANGDGCVFDTATSTLTVPSSDATGTPIAVSTDTVTVRFRATIDPS